MSHLSGYDSEAIGFDSVAQTRRPEISSSTQTTEFSEAGMGSQTKMSKDCGSSTSLDLEVKDDAKKEYSVAALNKFLQRVVPSMLEQLQLDDVKDVYNSSDSEDGEGYEASFVQEIKVSDVSGIGGGDQAISVLALSWSSAGNSIAVSVGRSQHENWCTHDGLVRIYTLKNTSTPTMNHSMDINEKNCVSAVKYHPSVAGLLSYGTTTGEVVMCDLRNTNIETLTSPSGCHGSKRISCLKWADSRRANAFLTMHINNTGKRRGASDQILISSGTDGTVNIWQVNFNMKIFQSIFLYTINGSRKMAAPDISCFDFVKSCPLQRRSEAVAEDVFIVGTTSGALYLCKMKSPQVDGDVLDPVYTDLDGHQTCVLDVSFSGHKPDHFVSISIDSELRLYCIDQAAALKIFHIEQPVSCVGWLPTNPCVSVVGLASPAGSVLLYNGATGKHETIKGLKGGTVTAMDVNQNRLAFGDADSCVRIFELPDGRCHLGNTAEMDLYM